MLMTGDAANGGVSFQDMDPQRIYTGEDIAFFSATIQRSLTAYKYSTDPSEGTTIVPDAATDLARRTTTSPPGASRSRTA